MKTNYTDNTPVENLGLSARATSALQSARILTAGQLRKCTKRILWRTLKVGQKSLMELLAKIKELNDTQQEQQSEPPQREAVRATPHNVETAIDEIDTLSPRTYNLLRLSGIRSVEQIAHLSVQALMEKTGLDEASADDAVSGIQYYLEHQRPMAALSEESKNAAVVPPAGEYPKSAVPVTLPENTKLAAPASAETKEPCQPKQYNSALMPPAASEKRASVSGNISDACISAAECPQTDSTELAKPEIPAEAEIDQCLCRFTAPGASRERILGYVRANDKFFDELEFLAGAKNKLHAMGYWKLSDIIFLTQRDLYRMRSIGATAVNQIQRSIDRYFADNAGRLICFCQGDGGALHEPISSATEMSELTIMLQDPRYHDAILHYVKENDQTFAQMDLPNRAKNQLPKSGMNNLSDIVFLTIDELQQVPNMGPGTAKQIRYAIDRYFLAHGEAIVQACKDVSVQIRPLEPPNVSSIRILLKFACWREKILQYVRANDKTLEAMELGTRARKQLQKNGYDKLSDICFLTESDFMKLPAMGTATVQQIKEQIDSYFQEHETWIKEFCTGDSNVLYGPSTARALVLKCFRGLAFQGLRYAELLEDMPVDMPPQRLNETLGKLLTEQELEYVDGRFYRVHWKFSGCLAQCNRLKPRSRACVQKRLDGSTLQNIADEYSLTRERVRQIVDSALLQLREWYAAQTGMEQFDEDYYQYLYETYAFDLNDAVEWLGLPSYIRQYFDLCDLEQGKAELYGAVEDVDHLDAGLRLKIKVYLQRDRLLIDGQWIDKTRAALEPVVVRKFCREDTSFDEFAERFNQFLEQQGFAFDPELFYIPEVIHSRVNRFSSARFVLWKSGRSFRYYDIDSQDYTELLETLNLGAYENTGLSTLKFIEEYPEVMKKYDIRDQYELHNLLRKIVPKGSYNNFHCEKMPDIAFGTFNRTQVFRELLYENAPIRITDLAALIHQEFGFEPGGVMANYLREFSDYNHMGVLIVQQPEMPEEHRNILKAALTKDFYFYDELRRIYHRLFPDADLNEINPLNIKRMGMIPFSHYALQHYDSLSEYFEYMLTKEDFTDLSEYRKRYGYVQMFYQTLYALKRGRIVIEYEPNKLLHFRRLEQNGISRQDLAAFCEEVWNYAAEDVCFTIASLRKVGFYSKLFDLGFSDWFYANLLLTDSRFGYGHFLKNLVFCKGALGVSMQAFLVFCVQSHGSIAVYDLIHELNVQYACISNDRYDLIDKLRGTQVYYDEILDRLYANAALYEHELDEMGD